MSGREGEKVSGEERQGVDSPGRQVAETGFMVTPRSTSASSLMCNYNDSCRLYHYLRHNVYTIATHTDVYIYMYSYLL